MEIDLNSVAKSELALTLMSREEYEELAKLARMTTKEHPIDKIKLAKEFREGIKSLEE